MSRDYIWGKPFYETILGQETGITYVTTGTTSVQEAIQYFGDSASFINKLMEEKRDLERQLNEALSENKYLKEIIEEGDVNVKT